MNTKLRYRIFTPAGYAYAETLYLAEATCDLYNLPYNFIEDTLNATA